MSGTKDVPQGLDTMSPEEQALFDGMRDDAPAPATPAPEPKQLRQQRVEPQPVETEPQATDVTHDDTSAADPGEDEGTSEPTRMVPHKVFHAEREKRKGIEAKLSELQTQAAADKARFEERFNALAAVAQAATAPPPAAPAAEEPLPDVTVDPVGHFQALSQRQAKQVEMLTGLVQGMQSQQQQASQIAQLRSWGAAQEQAFETREPTYREAMAHLERSRREELTALGVLDPVEQSRILGQDIQNIAVRARQEGANFAERLYALAQRRGYQKTAAATTGVPAIDGSQTTSPAAARQPAASVAAAAPTLDIPAADPATRLRHGRENATTIGAAGTAPPTRLSAAQIADMSEAQFSALLGRMEGNPTLLRDLLGH